MQEIQKRLKTQDIVSVIEYLNSIQEPLIALKLYSDVVKKLYWDDKGAKNLVVIGNAGIQYGFKKAQEVERSNNKLAYEYKSWSKTIAYDIGANTWPGWGDDGVVISQSDMSLGLEAAKLNLQLAYELKKPEDKVAMAHWLLGAHYLASTNLDLAIREFSASKEISKKINDVTSTLMAEGYIGICNIVLVHENGQKQFDNSILSLEKLGTDDAKYSAEQLKTALRIFSKKN